MAKKTIEKRAIKAPDLSIDDLYLAFIGERIFQGKAKSTIDTYDTTWELFKRYNSFTGTETGIDVLDKTPYYRFIAACQAKKLSGYTINHYLRNIKAFYNYCFKSGAIPHYDLTLVEVQETEPKFYTDDELELLLTPPTNDDDFVEVRTWVIVNLICATGARATTVCNIKVGDVDLKDKIIHFRHTKNRKILTAPITPALYPVLKKYIEEWRGDEDDWLFCTIDEYQMNRNSLRLSFDRYCAERGVESRGVHQIRHSFAHHAVVEGIDPFRLQVALGHSDLKMSQHYTHIWNQDLQVGFSQYTILDSIKKPTGKKKTISKNE